MGLHGVLFDLQVESSGRIDRPPPLPPHHPRKHIGPFTVQKLSNLLDDIKMFPEYPQLRSDLKIFP
jgi:hypothetical protein